MDPPPPLRDAGVTVARRSMFGQPYGRRFSSNPAGMESLNPRSTWRDYVGPFGNHLQAVIVQVDDSSAWSVGSRSSAGRWPKAISFTNTETSYLGSAQILGRDQRVPQTLDSRSPQPSKPWELPVARPADGRHWRRLFHGRGSSGRRLWSERQARCVRQQTGSNRPP
jgi:hypothetical protein